VRNLVGGFGWLFGLGVVALVGRYGYISSDNQVNGAILAFLFAGLASTAELPNSMSAAYELTK